MGANVWKVNHDFYGVLDIMTTKKEQIYNIIYNKNITQKGSRYGITDKFTAIVVRGIVPILIMILQGEVGRSIIKRLKV